MTAIATIVGREILDSRGNPTVEVDVVLEGGAFGRAAVPSGASTGAHEAHELRDGGKRYGGKGVSARSRRSTARSARRSPASTPPTSAASTTAFAISTARRTRSGSAPTPFSACRSPPRRRRRATAASRSIAISAATEANLLPVPMMNILNGGVHADNPIDFQEFMIVPVGAPSFAEALAHGRRRSSMR